jgi:uncharacterized protein YbjQ (UPF0145 family)
MVVPPIFDATAPRAFTSNLCTNEFLLLSQNGIRPITQVMGRCVYAMPRGKSSTSRVQRRVLAEVQSLALNRLTVEARRAKAHAVVGVRIASLPSDWTVDTVEMELTGTAVDIRGGKPPDNPVLTNLSGQEVWTLAQCGYVPLGLVMASDVSHASGVTYARQTEASLGLSMTMQQTRASVLKQVQRQVKALKGGLVATTIVERQQGSSEVRGKWSHASIMFTILVIGTAVGDTHHPASVNSIRRLLRARDALDQEEAIGHPGHASPIRSVVDLR